jgi:peptidoglycan/LPS O-acetylase OafA/YrhL
MWWNPAKPQDVTPDDDVHRPQLDGLRAVAVTAVMFQHFSFWGDRWGFAGEGVKLFFVLSGYLITRILLQGRESRSRGARWRSVISTFYIRRALRIFPLYYGVVIVSLICNLDPARKIWPWLVMYTINFYQGANGYYEANFAHFWSLAVEEQFYLVWPWVVWFTPRRWLIPLAFLFLATGPCYRAYAEYSEANGVQSYVNTLASLDSLGAGAILAMAVHFYSVVAVRRVLRWIVFPLSLAGIVFFQFSGDVWNGYANLIFSDFALSAFFAWLVYNAARGFRWIGSYTLGLAPVVYIGKISYGIYVLHEFSHLFCTPLAEHLGWVPAEPPETHDAGGESGSDSGSPDNPPSADDHAPPGDSEAAAPVEAKFPLGLFLLRILFSVSAASLSWWVFEGPINRLKRHFRLKAKD